MPPLNGGGAVGLGSNRAAQPGRFVLPGTSGDVREHVWCWGKGCHWHPVDGGPGVLLHVLQVPPGVTRAVLTAPGPAGCQGTGWGGRLASARASPLRPHCSWTPASWWKEGGSWWALVSFTLDRIKMREKFS